jgi:cyclic beta-1,2-glucan synthetase
MIATMAHPLNQPIYAEKKKRVTDGYTILQPRVVNSLATGASSVYARIHGNEPGTDPYTKAISDVYQDMFNEGSFIGKGIYDVASFDKTLKDRFPLNRILSHDLLEGAYARAGLISDVQLYEEYPSSYITDMRRRHRWVRGDWQLVSWILPLVSGIDNRLHKNPISILSKWKIFDNLRRSLVPLALMLLLLYGWTISTAPLFWTFIVLGIIFLPAVLHFIWQLVRKPDDALFVQHLIYTTNSLRDYFTQQLIIFVCLPYEAFVNADAILKTIWRLLVTRRKLLQWSPYANQVSEKTSVIIAYRQMWFAPLLAIAMLSYLIVYNDSLDLMIVLPFLTAWFLAPFFAWYISKSVDKKKDPLSREETLYLRKLARKIWGFFEQFVTKEDNWLPPDNYQEQPVERTAHRTSPTNIGLSLLANLSAYDFGYITNRRLLELTNNSITSIEKLEKYKGHLYNWYDTETLAPLHPKYISTVDSGNFIGHLITLEQGLLSVQDNKIITPAMFEGLLDEIRILNEIEKIPAMQKIEQDISENYLKYLDSLPGVYKYISHLQELFADLKINDSSAATTWIQKANTHINAIKEELDLLIPWLMLPPVPGKFNELVPSLPGIPSFIRLAKIEQSLLNKINELYLNGNTAEENDWLNQYRAGISASGQRAKEIMLLAEQLAKRCKQLADVEYDFLYDKSRHLLTIGYNAEEHRRDNSYYDLLASEARLATFVGIAMGKLPQQSWFALGRQLTNIGTTPILLSWSGSMFEYLMPQLVMPAYEKTLLDQTTKAVIQKQMEYGRKRDVPWGISESGYNMVDSNLNYQYHPFGVPGLGFKRGLGEDLVISPYSTIMALMVAPKEAFENLQRLKSEGFEGRFGFYEAIDYTSSRLLRKQNYAVVKSFMVHHQGMSFLSLAYELLKQPMQQRFEADVNVKSALLLLQERIPRVTTFYSPTVHEGDTSITPAVNDSMRVLTTPDTQIPEVQLLSNGRYHVMVTNAGGGYSRWKNIALTRWREDCTCDNWGTFCFIRDLDSNIYWSTAFQPALKEAENYEAVLSQGRAEFRRRDKGIETHTEIVVSPEDDIELRRVHITNRSRKKRTIEITSYAEVVLAHPMAEVSHPAFSNLFVETEIKEQRNAIVCNRRPRSVEERNPTMFHLMKVHDADIKSVSYETDREQFIGRGNTIHDPKIMNQQVVLSNSSGSVLDPVVSIQYRVTIEPYQTVIADMIFGIAETKEVSNFLIDKYQDRHLINRVLELAFTHSQVILRQINAVEADAQLYSRLASSIIFTNASMRADTSVILKNQRGQSGLWSYSISGDLPIVLFQIEDSNNIELVKQLVQAHTYWRLKGLPVDLVIWNEDHGGYRQVLQNQILGFVSPALSNDLREQPGGIFVRSADQISNEDRILFQTVAHIVISDRAGSLEEQVTGRSKIKPSIPYFSPTKFTSTLKTSVSIPKDLQFFNGHGGFSEDGKEYVIVTNMNTTPAPWINVLANRKFGSIVSESGQSYTWFENAHEFRLTPWNNDPVTDLRGEAYYIRDEESGRFWSPTPLPCRSQTPYITRHGFGYSVFEHSEDGIETTMSMYVDIEEPVKFIAIKISNKSQRRRKLSVNGYVEWVLGDLRSKTLMHVITEMDPITGAILARNAYNTEFENRVAFLDADGPNKIYTADRSEFIGRNGTMSNPDGMNRTKLSGKTGAALDPCAAIQIAFDLEEEEEQEVVFRLGAARNREDAFKLIRLLEGSMAAKKALEKVNQYWKQILQAVIIETPDPAINILSNGWLNYQTLACRYFARSGFYQSGGAFGFRDQLQDVLSLMHTQPGLAREQILLCASRQFKEGDVQHWWHPPVGRGVRTTCSDDFLWLPYVTGRYINVTGDTAILDENIHFLEGRLLNADEDSYYDLPIRSDETATLYRHCVAAIEHGLRFGKHGLPLIGSGDWNDGMDKVGHHGKGESVWLAFFLYDILQRFIEVAEIKNDREFIDKCSEQARLLFDNINEQAWDGDWYRRGYFDDGSPLGSIKNDECKIDSIAQSWSVLSNGGDPDKVNKAMRSAYTRLVKKEDHIIQLFTPPFDKSAMNPGYIKGYVPGVRENGGQYTHAAIWLVMAFAAMGDKQKTWELIQLINPINHGKDPSTIQQYKVEPYVIAADVYGVERHRGRGGWTWYTGSAGWMYQLVLESFIGLKRKGNSLHFKPCLPPGWPVVKIQYRYGDAIYNIELRESGTDIADNIKTIADGKEDSSGVVFLQDDKSTHEIKIYWQTSQVAVLEN